MQVAGLQDKDKQVDKIAQSINEFHFNQAEKEIEQLKQKLIEAEKKKLVLLFYLVLVLQQVLVLVLQQVLIITFKIKKNKKIIQKTN